MWWQKEIQINTVWKKCDVKYYGERKTKLWKDHSCILRFSNSIFNGIATELSRGTRSDVEPLYLTALDHKAAGPNFLAIFSPEKQLFFRQ